MRCERTMRWRCVGALHFTRVGRSEGVVARNLEFREENDSTVEAAKLRIQEQPRRGILIFPSPFCLCPKRGERPISCGIKHQFRAEWMALFFDVQIDGRRAAAPPRRRRGRDGRDQPSLKRRYKLRAPETNGRAPLTSPSPHFYSDFQNNLPLQPGSA